MTEEQDKGIEEEKHPQNNDVHFPEKGSLFLKKQQTVYATHFFLSPADPRNPQVHEKQ